MKTIDQKKAINLSKKFENIENEGLLYQEVGHIEAKTKCFGAHIVSILGGVRYGEAPEKLAEHFGIHTAQVLHMLVLCGAHSEPLSGNEWGTNPSIVLEKMAHMKVPTFEEIIEHGNIFTISNLAESQSTPPDILVKIVELDDECSYIAAKNPNLPLKKIKEIVNVRSSSYDPVLVAVARNPKTTVKMLEKLSSDGQEPVCRAVAENRKTPIKTLEKLAKLENWAVRLSVVENQKTPHRILKALSEDDSRRVRDIAKKALLERKK